MSSYYVLALDDRVKDQWELGSIYLQAPGDINPGSFWQGFPYPGPLPICADQTAKGKRLDLSWTVDMIPVVTDRAREAFERAAKGCFELLPLTVRDADERVSVLNVTALRDCVDPKGNLPMGEWRDTDRGFARYPIVVDPTKAEQLPLLRATKWRASIFVSERAKHELEATGVSGLAFLPTL